jgi:hypothetical protein
MLLLLALTKPLSPLCHVPTWLNRQFVVRCRLFRNMLLAC